MLDCFACGSEKRNSENEPILKINRIIEYIQYEFGKKNIKVWGDFFIENDSDVEAKLKILHPGNYKMSLASSDFFDDTKFPTKTVLTLLRPYGLDIQKDKISLGLDAKDKPYNVLKTDIKKICPTGDSIKNIPFSIYETVDMLPKNSKNVLRIFGNRQNETVESIISRENRYLIYGGEKLLSILKDAMLYQKYKFDPSLLDECDRHLDNFADEFSMPLRHDIILWEASGKHKLETYAYTTDLNLGCSNIKIGKKYVSWYYSNSSLFHVECKRNGLSLEVVLV